MSNKLKLSLKNQTTEMNVEVENLSDQQTSLMINNMFAVFGVEEQAVPNPWAEKYMDQLNKEAAPTIEMEVDYVVVDTPPAPVTKPIPVTKKPDPPKPSASRKLPMINHSERSSFSLADDPKIAAMLSASSEIREKTPKAQAKIDEQNDHRVTGIKIVDEGGVPMNLYRARCRCPKCDWSGNRYVRATNAFVPCFDCKTKLAMIPATNRDMIPDESKNFFYAHEEYIDLRGGTGVAKSGK